MYNVTRIFLVASTNSLNRNLMLFQIWTCAERQAAATGRGVSRGRRFQQFP
jgi:hypothetical protein